MIKEDLLIPSYLFQSITKTQNIIMYHRRKVLLAASGDLRISANQVGWRFQLEMESKLESALKKLGYTLTRAHFFDPSKGHGFIDSQKMGMEVFSSLDEESPIIIAESVWQYTHHVLPGLYTHKGPILTLANWNGKSSGLVGLLNLNGSLTKAGINYSSLWSETFEDDFFLSNLEEWLKKGLINHDISHSIPFDQIRKNTDIKRQGEIFAAKFKKRKAIMGVFDEGCMGMFNAIVPDHLLNPLGIFKERLSQSALYAEMLKVTDKEAEDILNWLLEKGMTFQWGSVPELELTKSQTLEQCKMYVAALRIADDFGCDTIGIQYQQGLKDLVAASDLVEGLLNNVDRPPVKDQAGKELYAGKSLPHFNEVDECAGIDAVLTTRIWEMMGMSPENTLHDIRWGESYFDGEKDVYVWVFLISGAAPPAHFINGYQGASSERQPPMYFGKGGGSLKGISKPGSIVWSRIYIENNQLFCDLGVGEVISLPEEETQRRWNETTSEWPIMHAVLPGITRDQLMAKHKANHIHVAYADSEEKAFESAQLKAEVFHALGITVNWCGDHM